MKYKNVKHIVTLCLIIGTTACSKDYFDVNTPPKAIRKDQVQIEDLLAPAIYYTMKGQYDIETVFGDYTQYFVDVVEIPRGETQGQELWSQVYLHALPNLKTLKEKALKIHAIHYAAIADILIAINLGIATDTWGDIPYSQASFGMENLCPDYDTQEHIYGTIFQLLDEAISNLKKEDASGKTPGKEDLIYEGASEKWLRAAYTLKARYLLRLLGKGIKTPEEVVSNIKNGFTSNADDFQLSFAESKSPNLWYTHEIATRKTGNLYDNIASYLVDSMNGTYYPFKNNALKVDPRLPVYATKTEHEAPWKGYGTDEVGNTEFSENGYHSQKESPLVLISYAEALFIKAEVLFLENKDSPIVKGTTKEAYKAYIDGIKASMSKYGIDKKQSDIYIKDASIDVGVSNLTLALIMKEKYIHNFLNPETFSDFRRHHFSNKIFKELTPPDHRDPESYGGEWLRRATYPSTEIKKDSTVKDINYDLLPTTPLWWEKS